MLFLCSQHFIGSPGERAAPCSFVSARSACHVRGTAMDSEALCFGVLAWVLEDLAVSAVSARA